jgi:L,D-peptidoglycan transpeptidase YkuD (ErfK/YbiS/YcfS/YnhG family)
MRRTFVRALALVSFAFLVGCAGQRPDLSAKLGDAAFAEVLPRAGGDSAPTRQVVVVLASDDAPPEESRFVMVAVYEASEVGGPFSRVLGPFPGVVGARGFASPGEKREGDTMSPTGRFTITELFGADPDFRPKLPYKLVTEEDVWSEDPISPMYNQWIRVDPSRTDLDRLKREDDLYRHAAVIDYNRWPVVPGAGSAIFMHKAEPDGAGTLGCVGLSTGDLDAVLLRLDPAMKPTIVMGRPRDLVATGGR